MGSFSVPRMLLTGALLISGAALAFLLGARAGTSLDRVMTFSPVEAKPAPVWKGSARPARLEPVSVNASLAAPRKQ
jgi:hypothetical protein